jgi:cell division protein FtsN
MGRDFAKKGQRKGSRKGPTTSTNHWLWLLSGAFIGILLTALSFFKLFPSVFENFSIHQVAIAPTLDVNTPEEKTTTPTPHFDFYSLLPELEVSVPEIKQNEAPPPAQNTTSTTTENVYRLQLGSFRDFADADRLKAQLALIGIQLEIEAVTLKAGDTWYRVKSPAYPDRASAESVQAKLKSQSIDSLLLEQKS